MKIQPRGYEYSQRRLGHFLVEVICCLIAIAWIAAALFAELPK